MPTLTAAVDLQYIPLHVGMSVYNTHALPLTEAGISIPLPSPLLARAAYGVPPGFDTYGREHAPLSAGVPVVKLLPLSTSRRRITSIGAGRPIEGVRVFMNGTTPEVRDVGDGAQIRDHIGAYVVVGVVASQVFPAQGRYVPKTMPIASEGTVDVVNVTSLHVRPGKVYVVPPRTDGTGRGRVVTFHPKFSTATYDAGYTNTHLVGYVVVDEPTFQTRYNDIAGANPVLGPDTIAGSALLGYTESGIAAGETGPVRLTTHYGRRY
jgi:hypothetical protein